MSTPRPPGFGEQESRRPNPYQLKFATFAEFVGRFDAPPGGPRPGAATNIFKKEHTHEMRSKTPRAPQAICARAAGAAAPVLRGALCLSLLCQSLLLGATHAGAQARPVQAPAAAPSLQKTRAGGTRLPSVRVKPLGTHKVNLRTLAAQAARAPQRSGGTTTLREVHAPLSIRESGAPAAPAAAAGAPRTSAADTAGPSAPSPAPAQDFLAVEDAPKVGTGVFTIPPDTMGAVGLDKVFTNVNNNYRVHDKTTGAALSTVSIDTFWGPTGATGSFDPRVVYDPYNNRWIVVAVSNAETAASSVLVGVSQTSDPQGGYSLFRFVVGCAGGAAGCNPAGEWADFPMLGFNRNWVTVSWNQFTIGTNAFVTGKVLALDYPTLRTGTAAGTLFSGADFCFSPATTFSATENTLYFVSHIGSADATYSVSPMTGTPAAPALALGPLRVRDVNGQGGWTQPGGDILPQDCQTGVGLPTQSCPPEPRGIDSGDSFVRSNVVFRGGRLYYSQTVALPAGGLTSDSRIAAQWTVLDASTQEDIDGGRVEDASATRANGGRHYAYPSITANRHGDILLGFSEFESDDYADAGYALRLANDPAGTMRDPVIYKEGEDYYSKSFSGARNRWGDYSHTVVDPSNDTDMWTVQEYAQLRVGLTGLDVNDSRWGTWWARVAVPAGAGGLVISELRLHGPGGVNDEFIEIYNTGDAPHTVAPADGSAGYSVVASDGTARFTIPSGTVIPARGHYLGCNSLGYSLALYPAGPATTATCDATYTTGITSGEDLDPGAGVTPAPRQGVALFRTAVAAEFTLANRLDAVGFAGTSNALYREGAGIPNPTFLATQHSFYRSYCPGNTAVYGTALGCAPGGSGRPRDTDANQNDFVYVDTAAFNAGVGHRIGAPGPENLSSPVERNAGVTGVLFDASKGASSSPNRVRDFTSDPMNNSAFGTLDIRRRFVNNTGTTVTRLRFRVTDITTFPQSPTFADLRARTSGAVVVSGVSDTGTCAPQPQPCTVTVQGTTLETPPAQTSGGGFNSSLSVTLPAPLAPGASVNVRFLLGIQQTGNFRLFLNVEALP